MSVSKYPVEIGDEEGQVDAINYLLSGPAGLGQNFAGFSTYLPAYLRPTVRQPFVTPFNQTPVNVYKFFPCNNATGCDENGTPVVTSTRYARYDFTTPFTQPPYVFGDRIIAQNFNPNDYDSGGSALVYACTTTYVIIRYNGSFVFPPYVSGGEVGTDYENTPLSTDCNGRVTVNGGSDRVFVSAQLDCDVVFDSPSGGQFDIVLEINRYTGYLTTQTNDNDFVFSSPVVTVARKVHHYVTFGSSPGIIEDINTFFVQFIDGPDIPFGYYWYILDFQFVTRPYYYASFAKGLLYEANLSGTSVSQVATYAGITPTTVTGIGVGSNVDVSIDTTNTTNYNSCATLTVNSGGTDYRVGDILSIPGTSLGGASPANDMTLEVTRIQYPGSVNCGVVTLNLRSLTAQVVKQ